MQHKCFDIYLEISMCRIHQRETPTHANAQESMFVRRKEDNQEVGRETWVRRGEGRMVWAKSECDSEMMNIRSITFSACVSCSSMVWTPSEATVSRAFLSWEVLHVTASQQEPAFPDWNELAHFALHRRGVWGFLMFSLHPLSSSAENSLVFTRIWRAKKPLEIPIGQKVSSFVWRTQEKDMSISLMNTIHTETLQSKGCLYKDRGGCYCFQTGLCLTSLITPVWSLSHLAFPAHLKDNKNNSALRLCTEGNIHPQTYLHLFTNPIGLAKYPSTSNRSPSSTLSLDIFCDCRLWSTMARLRKTHILMQPD